jgi:hypothetical protein
MPETTAHLSQKESERLKYYAEMEGITEDELLKRLAFENLRGRLNTRFKRGEVKAFKSPKSD